MVHVSNEINGKKFHAYHKDTLQAPIRENLNRHSNVSKKRVTVIGDFVVKFDLKICQMKTMLVISK